MKLISILILLTSISLSYSQTAKAPLNVIVTNKKGELMPNDKITFIARDSKQEIVGITDEKGYFKVHLPAGDEYSIKVEVVGEQVDYTSFEVPTPPPGAVFNTRTLEIRYELPESIVLKNVNFASGRSTIQAGSHATLDQLAEYLIRKKTLRIRVEGHTDSDGSATSNKILSENRAKAVKSYLVGKGVSSDMIEAKGLGEEKPLEDNSTESGKASNRRTEIHIIQK